MNAVSTEARVADLLAEIGAVDTAAEEAAAARHARLATPPGALGALEAVGCRLAAIARACPPPVPARPAVIVAAGDHGVHARGVTAWPQQLTASMVATFCAGGAGVNAVAASVGAEVVVVDVGVAGDLGDLGDRARLRSARVRAGTRDCTREPAMTRAEARTALLAGAEVARGLVDDGVDLLVPGDMGIANTTAAACLVAAFTGARAPSVTGPGAGADDETVARKTEAVTAALERHGLVGPEEGRLVGPEEGRLVGPEEGRLVGPGGADAVGALAAVGGLEHAALTGVILAAAAARVPVVLDGVSTVAAALVAAALHADVAGYLLGGHRSPEPGAALGLAELDLDPLVDVGLCLGEGTGGLLAVPLVTAAARVLNDVTSLADV